MTDQAAWRDEWKGMTPLERSFLITFFVGEYAFLLLLFGGAGAIVLGWDPGVHIALAGLTLSWFGSLGIRVTQRVYGALEMAPVALMMLGINLAALDWRFGVLLMLVGLIARVLGHLIVGVRAYREVMGRTWPSVTPLEDDDDW